MEVCTERTIKLNKQRIKVIEGATKQVEDKVRTILGKLEKVGIYEARWDNDHIDFVHVSRRVSSRTDAEVVYIWIPRGRAGDYA